MNLYLRLSSKVGILLASTFLVFVSCNQNNGLKNQTKFEKQYPQFAVQFEEKIEQLFEEKELYGNFIFAIVDENGLAYSYVTNRDILSGREALLNNNSPIYIASHTKSFTGTLLKILEEKGKLDINNRADTYLSELSFNGKTNIKSYLNHSHGTLNNLVSWKTAYLGYSGNNTEIINDLNLYSRYDSTHNFKYSNIGPIVASLIVEKVTGNSWKEEMNKNIFQPLKMENTSAYISDYKSDTIIPSLTVSKENQIFKKGFYKDELRMHASGGIISTVTDLSKWLTANINQDEILLSKSGWSELHSSTVEQNREYFTYKRIGYSLGWDVAEYQSEKLLTRFGGLGGISFHISFIPDKRIGIIAFSNDNRANLLPHLMANYAYNQLYTLPAARIFEEEMELFDKSFKSKNELIYLNENKLLKNSSNYAYLVGTYENAYGWPEISIDSIDTHFVFHWGQLKGKIYETEQNAFLSELGILNRTFEVKNDTLKTGSLIYRKKKLTVE